MKSKTYFKRSKQVGHTMLILAIALLFTLLLNEFKLGYTGLRIIQWILLGFSILFALLEFSIPFARITASFVFIYEMPFFGKRLLIKRINRVKILKNGRILVVFTSEGKRHSIYLKGIHHKERKEFILAMQQLVERNNDKRLPENK